MSDLWGVGEVDEQLHGALVNVTDHHLGLAALGQLTSKHGPEVGAAGWENDAVCIDLLGTDHQHDVTQLTVLTQQVDHLQSLPRVLVWHIGHAGWLRHALRQLVGVAQGAAARDVHPAGAPESQNTNQ